MPHTATTTHTIKTHNSPIWSVAWSPDATHLVTGGDGQVRLWTLDRGTPSEVAALPDSQGSAVRALAFAPDGQRIAVSTSDGSVKIVEIDDGELRQVVALLALPGDGWAVFYDDLTYKMKGNPAGRFWWSSGLCRFEPGELDGYGVTRLPADP